MLLFLWIFGTFVFASYFNWTVNARSILPMMPAVAILLMRRIEQRGMFSNGKKAWCTGFPLIPAAILALVVTWADYSLSDTARRAAAEINNSYKSKPVDRWFQGHWGFQYYMESGGGKAYDKNNFQVNDGDIMIIPSNNTNLSPVPEKNTDLVQTITLSPFPWLTTMHYTVGAGFYTDVWGPLPFMIGAVPSEKYTIFSIKLSK